MFKLYKIKDYHIFYRYPREVSLRWCSNTPLSFWTVSHNFGVNCTRHTIVKLSIELWQLISWKYKIHSNFLVNFRLLHWIYKLYHVGNLQLYTLASVISLTAAASTILRITNFLIALSLGTHLAQFVHLTGWTCPLPCFERPPLRLLQV